MNIAQFTTEASKYAAHVDDLFYLLSIVSGIIVVLVTGAIVVFFALYYRGSSTPRGAVASSPSLSSPSLSGPIAFASCRRPTPSPGRGAPIACRICARSWTPCRRVRRSSASCS